MPQYSLEDYRRAFERAIGFIMGNSRARVKKERVSEIVDSVHRIIDWITYIPVKRYRDLQEVLRALEEAYEEIRWSITQDERVFMISVRGTYQDLLDDISEAFDEFNTQHIAEVLGISKKDVEDLWLEGFANVDAIALEYYRTLKAVMQGLKELSEYVKEIMRSYGREELLDGEPREMGYVREEVRRLEELLLAANEYADEFVTAVNEAAINTLLFFLEEIERRIASEA